MLNTISQKVVLFPFDGQLLRLCTIASTLQPVMYGVMAVYSMRYGVLDTNHLKTALIHKYSLYHYNRQH